MEPIANPIPAADKPARAERMGAAFDVDSGPGGTSVSVVLRMPEPGAAVDFVAGRALA